MPKTPKVTECLYYVGGEIIAKDRFGYSSLFAVGQSLVIRSRGYVVERVTVKDETQHVYLEEDSSPTLVNTCMDPRD